MPVRYSSRVNKPPGAGAAGFLSPQAASSTETLAVAVSDMDRAYSSLERHNVARVSPRPQRLPDWNKNAGGIEAFYFKDPDGHLLEYLAMLDEEPSISILVLAAVALGEAQANYLFNVMRHAEKWWVPRAEQKYP